MAEAPAPVPTEAAPPMDATAAPLAALAEFLARGGPAMWAIGALSVIALAIALWKVWRLVRGGAWRGSHARRAVALWRAGDAAGALAEARAGRGYLARLVAATIAALVEEGLEGEAASEEAERVARALLAEVASGLRALELIAMIAPLLGLLGTVLGMISAFQALEAAGVRADAATLAGGIWEALLTTAAGMTVAIPVWVVLTWFESVVDRLRHEMEDLATRILSRPLAHGAALRPAAE